MAYDLIKEHEGLKLKPYRCTAGKLTIGYGINLDDGITLEEADALLQIRASRAREDLQKVFTEEQLRFMGVNRMEAMVDMMFNLGLPRFKTFKNMIKAIREGRWEKASAEMISSRWAMQVGHRATHLADIVKSGKMTLCKNYY